MSATLASPAATSTSQNQLCINTIRTLSMDAVQHANSGHPGTAMALEPLVYTIWNRLMNFDPQDAIWPNRDRFVLSNGHASMLLWSVLRLTKTEAVNAEYETLGQPPVTLDDIRHFRQLNSKAPGHPEYHDGPDSTFSTTTSIPSAETIAGRKALGQRRLCWLPILVSTTYVESKTTITSRSKAARASPSLRAWQDDSWPTDGTCSA
jgi:transketolase N-terminal domain/subunit